MVLLHTSKGAFEYTGCNSKVTVAQLKAHLRFNGIPFGSKILKKDLCDIIDRLQEHVQRVQSGKQQGLPLINYLMSETPQQKKKRMRSKTTLKK